MSLRTLNPEYEEKPTQTIYLLLGVLAILVIAAAVYVYSSPKASPQETSTTSTLPPITTTTIEATTTTSTTTTSEPTTTTTIPIVCFKNSDCGIEKEEEVCYQGSVYLRKTTPLCKKPGTIESLCMAQQSWVTGSMVAEPVPVKKCKNGCQNATCL